MWLGGKTGVDDDLMDEWLAAVIKAARRGVMGKKLEACLVELVDHLSNGNLAVVRQAAPATDTAAPPENHVLWQWKFEADGPWHTGLYPPEGVYHSEPLPSPETKTLASKEELNEIARALQDLWSVVKPEPRPSPFDAVWREYAAEIRRVVLKNTPPQERSMGEPDAWMDEFGEVSTVKPAINPKPLYLAETVLAASKSKKDAKPDNRHRFVPNKKFPWFCASCGYSPHEPLMHFQPELIAQIDGPATRGKP